MTTVHLGSGVRRAQIVQTARRIVADEGMASLTINGLAAAVGVSEGAIYRHFKSKDDILLALVREIESNLLRIISDSARPEESSLDHLRRLLKRHFSSLERRNAVSFVVIAEAMCFADDRVKQAARQMVERYLETIAAILKEGAAKGEVGPGVDVKAAAIMFFGMVQASVTLWTFSNRAHPLSQHSAALWGMLKEGVTCQDGGGPPEPVRRRKTRRTRPDEGS
ncbi:MAG: TetR/AcrR family transcriptional regulator [Dehalococcoidia bacterium]|nr:TetR/AcrR family transcriptional regulator [Dehalococcoidia bacterium]